MDLVRRVAEVDEHWFVKGDVLRERRVLRGEVEVLATELADAGRLLGLLVAGGRASQKVGAAGIGNLEKSLLPELRSFRRLMADRLFPMLRTQLEASCATQRNQWLSWFAWMAINQRSPHSSEYLTSNWAASEA